MMAMSPRSGASEVAGAVARCPFLHAVNKFQGEECAARLAVNPFASVHDSHSLPVLPEDPAGSVAAVFKLFHGKGGAIPLKDAAAVDPPRQGRCPMHNHSASTAPILSAPQMPEPELYTAPALPMMASISLSGFRFLPDPGDMFRRNQRHQKPKKQKKPDPKPKQHTSNNGSPPGATASASTGAAGTAKPPSSRPSGGRPSNNISKFSVLGGLLPLAASGKLSCPPVIVAMRAAVAGLKPVRQLRPQALPIRSLAMAGTAIMANVPAGMWREHTRKFSPEWFVAVHATIPFVGMLRKAVLMPKWAMLLTIAGAIAGQQVGAKLERARLGRTAAGNASEKSQLKGSVNVWQRCGLVVSKASKLPLGGVAGGEAVSGVGVA